MIRGKNKKRKPERYAEYYERTMEPIWTERWKKYLKRVKALKKDISRLGPIPTEEKQLIKTINYFVKIIDVVTDFYDDGLVKCAPKEKAQALINFNDMVFTLVAREKCTSCYLNKSEVGKRVTANNLYLGMFNSITNEDELNNIKTEEINGSKLKVEVDFTSISEWINGRAVTLDGYRASISQKQLAKVLKGIQSIILEVIDEILKE